MTSPLRIVLIGAGVMGRQHHQHLQNLTEARLCAIADPGPQAAEFAAQCAVPCFADHQQMLEQVRPEAVIVANPNALHVSTALDCIAVGVPVLLEKPVGVHLDEVRELVAASERSGVPVLVGHHRRHNPLIARARELIEEGALGRLTTVTALWQVQKPDSYYDIAWRREAGAGMLLTNLIHDLDLLRHLCGEVRQVQAITSNGVRGFANEDSAAVLLQFEGGALGSLTGSDGVAAPWSWEMTSGENPVYPRQADQPCYLLAGTRGALSVPQLKHWQYSEAGAGWHQPLQQVQEHFDAGEALRRQLQHFVQVARGQVEPLASAADAGRTLALVEAIRQAAESGQACVPETL
ncbi:gfo/Idh/MocA family oxidoreductase [Ectopseudomonas toyotomiensis]|uniref:Predicted dehydrogenase n=1 Tax=Ectopseudomonas toyotomiensis TaxID=554344 RepID=A0A1I5YBG1_9GAMM|nr:Gfo/Idh/MocA family oxidoreductase [Pseudomonas toyotomiensis]PIA68666.1 gfo/Idh/MocA family oxidoreductase [Pseudomonas toyotomiensis]SFQ41565.1 Predicted dehydrogenase [Pseudomonas toyotomiensis]